MTLDLRTKNYQIVMYKSWSRIFVTRALLCPTYSKGYGFFVLCVSVSHMRDIVRRRQQCSMTQLKGIATAKGCLETSRGCFHSCATYLRNYLCCVGLYEQKRDDVLKGLHMYLGQESWHIELFSLSFLPIECPTLYLAGED